MNRIFDAADKGDTLWGIDVDIKDYFGSISHDKLLIKKNLVSNYAAFMQRK